MAKQPGTIVERGRGVWQIQLNTGVKVNGKYQRVYKTVKGTKRDAQAELRKMVDAQANGIDLSGGKLPFDTFAREWLETKKETAPRTYRDYASKVEVLCEMLGSTELAKIDARTVELTLAAIKKTKGRNGSASNLTVKHYEAVLSQIMKKAVLYRYVSYNPCTDFVIPKGETKERRSLNVAQYSQMWVELNRSYSAAVEKYETKEAHLKKTGHHNKERHAVRGVHEPAFIVAALLCHNTGMRPSEVFALQWDCIDLSGGKVTVKQATATEQGGVKATKSNAGKRTLDIEAPMVKLLANWRAFVSNAANNIGVEIGAKSFVACTDSFTQVHHANFRRWWLDWTKKHGFEGWLLYELRHTQATLLLSNGEPAEEVRERMGHEDISTTLKYYTHATPEGQKKCSQTMAAFYCA